MEKRAILAFGLSMLLLVAYVWVQERYFSAPPPPERRAPSGPQPGERPVVPPGPATSVPSVPPAPPVSAPAAPVPGSAVAATPRPRPPQTTANVETPLYHAVVSSEGGKFQEWTLHYRGEKPMVAIGDNGPGGLVVAPTDAKQAEPVAMSIMPQQLQLGPERGTGDLKLAGEESGLQVRQELRFVAEGYQVDIHVRVENPGPDAKTVHVMLPWSTRQQWTTGGERFHGQRPTEVVWSEGGHVARIEDLTKVVAHEADGEWVSVGSVWYLAALVPKTPGFRVVMRSEQSADAKTGGNGRVMVGLRATPTIAPGQVWEGHVVMYIGPKEYERLAALGLERAINFGGFPIPRAWGGLPMEWVGVPILLLMKWLYRYVGNYGLAIILLTVVTKILFYPLSVKSIRSMKAMQALQPQVNALRTKYKSDPQRAQREMMELYRKYRVNPMGGCLPMVAQVPVFYALYLALSVSVELQNAPFLCFGRVFGVDLWICDLAAHDPTYVLPIMMGVTMFVQQKMMPTTADPRQAKMMLFMPFVFTFMFLNLPSGLVLYWTVSNALQILQQWYMERAQVGAVRGEAKDASRA